jgi:CheY-like chemotaxis protein
MPEIPVKLFKILNKLTGEGEVNQVIRELLQFLGITFSIDITVIFEFYTEKNETFLSQKFRCQNGSTLINSLADSLPSEKFFPGWIEKMKNRSIIHSFARNLPQPQKIFFQSINDKTILIIPIIYNDFLYGCFCFSRQYEKLWKEEEIQVFKMVAGFISIVFYNEKIKEENTNIRKYLNTASQYELLGIIFYSLIGKISELIISLKNFLKMNFTEVKAIKNKCKEFKNILSIYYFTIEKLTEIQEFIEKYITDKRPSIDIISITENFVKFFSLSLPDGISMVFVSKEKKLNCLISAVNYLQIIRNFITGCLDHAGPGGRIKISINKEKDKAVVTIILIGIEFSEEGNTNFFFVKHLLSQVKGSNFIVKSISDIGSSFQFIFPLQEEKKRNIIDKENLYGKGKILIIDDNEEILSYQKNTLQEFGYSVTVETIPEKALKIFKKHPDKYDLIIIDYVMPFLNGFEFIRQVREVNSKVPVILHTAFPQMLQKEKLPGVTVLSKKGSFRKLLKTVKYLLKNINNFR